MSQRNSNYARKSNDAYFTPPWVTRAVASYLGNGRVWEPACGNGSIVNELKRLGFKVSGTDLATGHNFLDGKTKRICDIICTNPPYGRQAQPFIERALYLTKAFGGQVAMLLKEDFDCGVTRRHIFAEHPAWCKKIVLNYRIRWFESASGAGPSENHAWFLWDWQHQGKPTIEYPVIDPDAAQYVDVGNKPMSLREPGELFT